MLLLALLLQGPAPKPALHTTGAFFAVAVPSLAASRAWYERVLGLTTTRQMTPSAGTSVAILEGGGLIVELIESAGATTRPESDEIQQTGLFKAGVIVDDFEATVRALRERGARIAFGPFPARDGQRANVIVRDTSGTLIQFFGPQ